MCSKSLKIDKDGDLDYLALGSGQIIYNTTKTRSLDENDLMEPMHGSQVLDNIRFKILYNSQGHNFTPSDLKRKIIEKDPELE